MPHLTLFGMHYAPEPSGNAPYTTALCEHLALGGWDVDVHTGQPHYPEWVKQSAPRSSTINGVRVHRHRHHVPSKPNTAGRAAMDGSWSASTAPAALRRLDTDVVMGVVPNLSAAGVALSAARRSNVPCVLWFQDLMGQAAVQSGIEGGSRVARAVRTTETAAARRADAVVVVSGGFTDYLESGGVDPDRIRVVRNWSLMEPVEVDRPHARTRFGFTDGQIVAVHSGNMGAKQGLGIVLDTAEIAPDIMFVLQGNGSEKESLREESVSRGLANVMFLPSLLPDELADLLGAADVLLLTQRPTVTDMSLPSKLTTYLTVGTPVAASINPASEAAALLADAECADVVAAGDPEAFAGAIRSAQGSAGESVDPARLFGSPGEIETILTEVLSERTT
ncbi:MAG: glycosyltransferase [Acidimicrobiia bacterium]